MPDNYGPKEVIEMLYEPVMCYRFFGQYRVLDRQGPMHRNGEVVEGGLH